jgi:hypothetical protein
MKRFVLVLSMTLAALGTAPVWAQGAAASGAQATQSADSIVQMRTEISAANSAYRAKVRAADKVRDQEVAKARAVRDKAIEEARAGVSSS